MAKRKRVYRREPISAELEKINPTPEIGEDEKEQPQESVAKEDAVCFRVYNPIKAGHTVTVTVDNCSRGVKFDENCVSEPVIKEIYDILIKLPRFEPYKEQ